ncbi:MAG: knotted carbamoyltransferase YgeW [Candidatus Cloacimonetes bacterium 4572_65]|nr:MAG: knotted carbamoyltransferase YgeW [Candidatus Cloacimonetes bacterium 4572_65]
MDNKIVSMYEELSKIDFSNYGKNFLLTKNKSILHIKGTILLAELLKSIHQAGKTYKTFESGLAISIFRDNSTRTRFSYSSAANALGLGVQDLDEMKSQIAHGETVRETANMISFLAELIGIRDDMYLGEGHTYMVEVADSLDMGFKEGVLHQRPGLINLQCDIDHPTQSMADLAKLKDYFGSFEQLKGKKIAMTWAYSPSYGKPLSVPQGIISLMTRFGMEVVLAHPEGYNLLDSEIEYAKQASQESGGSFTVTNSMEEAFRDADIVYPKSWAPMSVMQERTALLMAKDSEGLKQLEGRCLENNKKFIDWECTSEMMNLTKSKEALYMHCLPADITGVSCSEGEVAKDVFDKYRRETYHQASYKPFIISAMAILTRFDQPEQQIKNLYTNSKKRF